MKKLALAALLSAAAFALPQPSAAVPNFDRCAGDCTVICYQPGSTSETLCTDRCGTWSRTSCGSNWNDGPCASCN